MKREMTKKKGQTTQNRPQTQQQPQQAKVQQQTQPQVQKSTQEPVKTQQVQNKTQNGVNQESIVQSQPQQTKAQQQTKPQQQNNQSKNQHQQQQQQKSTQETIKKTQNVPQNGMNQESKNQSQSQSQNNKEDLKEKEDVKNQSKANGINENEKNNESGSESDGDEEEEKVNGTPSAGEKKKRKKKKKKKTKSSNLESQGNQISQDEKVSLESKSTISQEQVEATKIQVPVKFDSYQTEYSVTMIFYTKNRKEEEISVNFDPTNFSINIGSDYRYSKELFALIDPKLSNYKIFSTKIEVKLIKVTNGMWPSTSIDSTSSEIPLDNLNLNPSSSIEKIEDPNQIEIKIEERHEETKENIEEKVEEKIEEKIEEEPPSYLEVQNENLNNQEIINEKNNQELTSFGLRGLVNIGNTCYMSSALQCLSSTQPLLKYFWNDQYLKHINLESTFGRKGKVATSFAQVLKDLWMGDDLPAHRITEFKSTIEEFHTQFRGYRQHDSQEFLTFLLDDLHEDLNLILDKRNVQNVEDNEKSAEESAMIHWENHKKRNDSIIVDLFQGQYQSKLTCQVCQNTSLTFEPFMSLSVPIPQQTIYITFVQKISLEFPKKYGFKVKKETTVLELLGELSKKTNIATSRLLLAEVDGHKFQNIYRNNDTVESFPEGDKLFAYEVETTDENDPNYTLVPIVLRFSGRLSDICSNCYRRLEGLKRCQQCRSVSYCSRECQEEHWKEHKENCKASWILFGIPLLLSMKKFQTTYKSLSLTIFLTLRRFIQNNKVSLQPAQLFKLRYFEGSRYNTLVPEDGILDVELSPMIAVDWDIKEKKLVFGDQADYVIRDESAIQGNSVELKDCLELNLEEELLDGSWLCPKCKVRQKATKKLSLSLLPPILVIHLKRFSSSKTSGLSGFFSSFGMAGSKLNTMVQFPTKDLDLTGYIEPKPKDELIYDLFAVTNHFGGTGFGHYTAFCKRVEGDQEAWFEFDDTKVSEVQNVQTAGAYVLFYKLKSFQPNDQ